MSDKTQYLIVNPKCRRHSAPEPQLLYTGTQRGKRKNIYRCSVSDFSTLQELQSESGSSLELDTSALSKDLTSAASSKSSEKENYTNLSDADFEFQERDVDTPSGWNGFRSWLIWRNIILCQIVAGCLAAMIVSNDRLRQTPRHLITNGQNLPHYFLLSILWTTKLAVRNSGRDIIEIIKFSGIRYFCLSFLHVHINYLLLETFHRDSYFGNQTIDCVAATSSLVIGYILLEIQFHSIHVLAFSLTILGGFGLCVTNFILLKETTDNMLLGDILRIASGLSLAYNSVTQEIIIKSIDQVEYMGMIGLIGSLICGVQVLAMDAGKVFPKTFPYWLNISIYSLAQFSFSCLTPKVLRSVGATGFHLALISNGFYSYFFGVTFQENDLWYMISFAAAMMGSALFAIKRTAFGTTYFFPVRISLPKGQ